MNINKVVVGLLRENCYILSIENDVLIIDPGDEYQKIMKEVGSKKIIGILITHYHEDHVGALENFDKKIPIYDFSSRTENTIEIGPFSFSIIETTGHTKDSVSFYFKNENSMFVGDFIFKESIGRCDLGGNEMDMKKSLEKIKKYPDVVIYPGHGEITSLAHEKNYNPFF